MGLLDPPAVGVSGTPLGQLDPLRDLPGVLGAWDAAQLRLDVGAKVDALPDLSGYAQDLQSYTTGSKPMTIALRNGLRVIRTNGTANALSRAGWGQRWGGLNTPTPLTVFAVASATVGSGSNPRTLVGAGYPQASTLTAATTSGTSTITTGVAYPAGTELIVDTSTNREVVTVATVTGSSAPYTLTTTTPTTISHASGVAITPNQLRLALDGTGFAPVATMPTPSSTVGPGGPPLNDNALHVYTLVIEPNFVQVLVDGVVAATSTFGSAAATSILDLYFGTAGPGSLGLDGDLAQLIICRGILPQGQIRSAVQALGRKWGITIPGRADLGAFTSRIDGASANGQVVRILPPPPSTRTASGSPLIIWSHPHGHTQGYSPSYFAWPLLFALNNAGFAIAASNMHGNNWGNQQGLDDNKDLYDRVVSYFGTPSAVIMIGASMGGLASLLAIPDGRIPNIKGVYLVDGVCNLANLYGAGSNTYSTPIATAYGMANASEYAAKTAGHDPSTLAASTWTGKRLRFLASTSDTDVPKANNADSFAAAISAQATESVVVTHAGGHLAGYTGYAADVLAFAKRCIA